MKNDRLLLAGAVLVGMTTVMGSAATAAPLKEVKQSTKASDLETTKINPEWSYFMGAWDTDGDGVNENVFNEDFAIVVREFDGSSRSYPMGGNYAWMKTIDTDGQPGMEILMNVGYGNVKTIHDRTRSVTTDFIALNWVLMQYNETNAKPGSEVIFNTGADGHVRVYSDYDRQVRAYYIGGNWQLSGIFDFNGQPGNEIVFSTPRTIIYDTTRTMGTY